VSGKTTVLDEVGTHALDNDVYFYTSVNTIVVTPPLTISEAEVDEAVAALDEALEISDTAMDT